MATERCDLEAQKDPEIKVAKLTFRCRITNIKDKHKKMYEEVVRSVAEKESAKKKDQQKIEQKAEMEKKIKDLQMKRAQEIMVQNSSAELDKEISFEE